MSESNTSQAQSEKSINEFIKKNWFIIIIVIYIFVPLDLIPDNLPLIGTVDDSGLLLLEVVRRYANFKKK